MTDRKDKGKAMKPPADATHCGGYPIDTPAPERILIAIHDGKIYGHNPPEDAPTHTYFHASRIAELEAENARLRGEVAALKSPPEEYCAKCGSPKSNHPYRHPFTPRAALDKGEG